jgi:hypothetical protein
VVLHAHLFKNAGTTLDWSLARFFGERFLDHRDDAAMRGNPAYLNAYLDEHPELSALSSHWLPLPPASAQGRFAPLLLTLLRDPIERVASVYEFERRQSVDHPGTRRAREGSLRDYVAWRLRPGVGPVLRNYQVRMLSGIYPGEGDESQLERALAHMHAFTGIGLVERYDESVVAFEADLSPHFPGIDLAYRPQNVRDAADTRSPARKREAVELALGDLLQPLLEVNQLDLVLYAEAERRLRHRLENLLDRNARLADLRRRCDDLCGA